MRKRKMASAVAYVLIFAIAIALFNGTTSFAAETIASGTCGENATWTLDSDGLLVISGTGETSAFQCDEGVWTSYKNKVKRVVIEDGIISLYPGLFKYCVRLTDVSIPDSVLAIGVGENNGANEGVFEGCVKLASITVPESVTSIGSHAFSNCSSLTTITIPDGVTSIEDYAFSGCSSLTTITIPDSVTSIGIDAFSGCSSLTTITIPDSVTSIGWGAFSGCSSLTTITIPDGVTSIGNSAFYECSSLTTITIPDGVTSIEDYAFSGCSSLTTITIPDSVTSIGEWVFSGCSSLTTINIPYGVTRIENYAFSGCSSLTTITIPDSLTSIGRGDFSGCSSLTTITIPDSVTSIGDDAFSGCSSLTTITIPDSVTRIGDYAFSGCSSLTTINIPDSVTSIGGYAFLGCSSLTTINIPDSVTSIGGYAFFGCSLTTINIPYGVTSIDDDAFLGCSSLTTITIPDSVTRIGDYAFAGCKSLTSITIPYSVTSIGDCAFIDCGNLKMINVASRESYVTNWALENSYCVYIEDEGITIGHKWNNPTYIWSADNKTCTATRVCGRDATHVETETVNATSEVIQPTCTTPGTTKYTATFASEAFATQIKTENDEEALGHNWSAPTYTWSEENKTCTATRVCQNDASHVETETVNTTSEVIQPTCTTLGTTKYTATFASEAFVTQTKTEKGEEATGHDWSAPTYTWSADGKTCTATRVCKTDPSHKETEIATVANKMVKANTIQKYVKCKTNGVVQYTATFKNAAFKSQTKKVTIPAHAYGKVTYTWSKDGKTCTATRVCSNNKAHKQTETVNATATVVKNATATAMGQTKYTATFKNTAFKQQTVTKTDIKIAQPMAVVAKTTSKKPVVVKFANLRNKNQVVAAKNAYAVSKAQGKVACKKLSGNANFTVASNGNIFVKKGTAKGVYAVKVRVTAAGGAKYKAGYKDVVVYVQVK